MPTSLTETRASYDRLRSICRDFNDRLILGQAIRNGWPASAIEEVAQGYGGPGSIDRKRLSAIYDTAKRQYYSPEQRAADWAAYEEAQAAADARDAVKATKATRPKVPPEYASLRAACRSMLDCDHLSWALEEGWTAEDIRYLARQHSAVVGRRIPNIETPGAIRLALGLIQGREAGVYRGWLPRPSIQQKSTQKEQAA
ncbi:hypothetical protein JQ604_06040 [Bradyrhizobium jicamae]|uniref:hypothetical protein n=1 Tax=Bradyrhizobium jicamae TaxID=280332 RepID=UPI001BAD5668|nr:hypothetical protein [Bradyrhizobium jicamae]MBR0751736.1 hypothetical protein [Bradyrhizobium jicamae]